MTSQFNEGSNTVKSRNTTGAINVKYAGNRHIANLLPWQSNSDQDKGETLTVLLFPKLFLNVNGISLHKTFLEQELAY